MKTKNKMPKIINLGYQYDLYWRFSIDGFTDDYWEAHCPSGRFNRIDNVVTQEMNMKARYSNATKAKIEEYRAAGYEIVYGNNPFLNKAKKRTGMECVRICQTNSKRHGKSMWTVWATKTRD